MEQTNNHDTPDLVADKAGPTIQSFTRDPTGQPQQLTFKLSRQRWLVLLAMAIYGLFVAALSEFRPILSVLLKLLELDITDYTYIKQMFMYLPALTSIPTGWFIDKYGLKATMYVATLFMLIGNGFRYLMFNPQWANSAQLRVGCWIVSGFAAVQGAGIYFCAPLKVSENWFGESERSIAWTVLISAYNIGSSVASFLLPRIVTGVGDIRYLAYINLISGLAVAAGIFVFIDRSKPKSPPSERMVKSSQTNLPWLRSIKRMLGQRDIILHLVHETIYESMTLAAHSFIQPILVRSGHSSVFVGNVLSINSLLSVVMMIALATVVHRIRDVTSTCKLASVIRTFGFILHLYSMLYEFSDGVVLALAVLYVVCKCWSLPNNNNMTAHLICGTISEATVTGVSVTLYTTFASISSIAFVKFRKEDGSDHGDYTESIAMASIVCLLNSAVYLVLFRGQPAAKQDAANETTTGIATDVIV